MTRSERGNCVGNVAEPQSSEALRERPVPLIRERSGPQRTGPHTLRQRHRSVLCLTSLIVVAAFVLQVAPDRETVHLRGVSQASLPNLCFYRKYTGIPCPGCGLTRSFIYLAEGNLSASWSAHRLGWLIAGLFLVQVPYRAVELLRPGKFGWTPLFTRWLWPSLIVLILGNYLFGLL